MMNTSGARVVTYGRHVIYVLTADRKKPCFHVVTDPVQLRIVWKIGGIIVNEQNNIWMEAE